jgi:hypothetical protein
MQETLASYSRSMEKTSDPKAKAQIKAQRDAYLLLQRKFTGKNQAELLKENETQTEIETKNLNTANESLNNLVQLNKSNAQTLEIARMQLEASPDLQKYLEQKGIEYAKTGNMDALNALESFSPGIAERSKKATDWRPELSYSSAKGQFGTKFATGVPTLVGERGPEWMVPPRGAQIYPHGILPPASADQQRGGVGGGGTKTISITINASANPQQIANVVQTTLHNMNIV